MQASDSISEHCVHLGLQNDPQTALGYPSEWNLCHRVRPPASVRVGHQVDVCLKPAYLDCPVYRAEGAVGQLPPQLRGQPSAALRRVDWNGGRAVWLILLVVLALLAVWWGRHFLPLQSIFAIGKGPVPAVVVSPTASVEGTGTALSTPEPQQTDIPILPTFYPSNVPVIFPTLSFGACGHALDEEFGTDIKFVIHHVRNGENLDIYTERYQTSQAAIQAVNFSMPVPIWTDWIIVIPLGATDVTGLPSFEPHQVTGRSLSLSEIVSQWNVDEVSFQKYNAFDSTCAKFDNWFLIPHERVDG
jgi:hypothetical protein